MTRPLFILSLFLSAAGMYCTEPVRLCLSAPVGTTARYNATSTLGQSLNVMGRDVISEVSTTLGLTITVKEKLMQRCAVSIVWSDGHLTTRTIGNEADTKSDSTLTIPTYGLTQQVVLTPTGMTVSETADLPTQQQAEVLAMVRATKIPEHLFIPLPPKPVVVGDQWSKVIADTSAAPQGRGSVITTGSAHYTYRGIVDTLGKPFWVIEVTSNNLEQHGTLYGAAIAMKIDGSGSLHGVSLIDGNTGMLFQSRSRLETNVVMASTEQGSNSIRVPVHSQVNILINRVEGKGW